MKLRCFILLPLFTRMAAMKSTTVLLTCLFGLLLILASSFGEGFEAPIQDRIRAVENGLESSNSSGQRPEHRDLLTEMKRLNVPAVSIAVVHGGKIEWAKGYGLTRADGTAVNADTLFQAASISKSITAMAALNLVEHGRLSLDAPIRTELKSWTLPQNSSTSQHPVTLRELLSNTAGTSVDGFDGYAAGQPIPTLTQILNGTKPANSAPIVVEAVPGSEFRYSGGGFTIVQQMMIDATGKPHGKPIPGGSHIYPEMAAAGLWTTPSDLALWTIEMQNSLDGKANHVLSPEMTRTMLTKVIGMPKEPDVGYGLGVALLTIGGKPAFTHGGRNEGYQCNYFAFKDGDGAVVMTNSDNADALIHEIMTSIAHVYGWPKLQEHH